MTPSVEVSIDWAEDLVEDERDFYVRLSPKVSYKIVGVEQIKKAVAERALHELQKAAKEKRKK